MDNILHEADKAVNGARKNDYGSPWDNHTCTADMVTSFLKRRGLLREGFRLSATDICFINIIQKVSRSANIITHDGLVDIAGYARNAQLIVDQLAREGYLGTNEEVSDLRPEP